MLVRQDSPSTRTNGTQQSNDFTDFGTLEANSWFIGSRQSALCANRCRDTIGDKKRKNLA
jgi:hypothetical protein